MRSATQLVDTYRNALARMLATRPMPEVTTAALQFPLTTRHEVDEAMLGAVFNLEQAMDFFARLRAREAVEGINYNTIIDQRMESPEGQAMLLAIIAGNSDIIEQRVNMVVNQRLAEAADANDARMNRIITERLEKHSVQVKHRWHKPAWMSWVGAFFGAILGAVIGIVLNMRVFVPTTIDTTEPGRYMVISDNFDTPFGVSFIFGACVIIFAALGGALFQRNDSDKTTVRSTSHN